MDTKNWVLKNKNKNSIFFPAEKKKKVRSFLKRRKREVVVDVSSSEYKSRRPMYRWQHILIWGYLTRPVSTLERGGGRNDPKRNRQSGR